MYRLISASFTGVGPFLPGFAMNILCLTVGLLYHSNAPSSRVKFFCPIRLTTPFKHHTARCLLMFNQPAMKNAIYTLHIRRLLTWQTLMPPCRLKWPLVACPFYSFR